MKKSNRSIRRYRDSQAKLIIAKRRYQDSLRRYQDAEESALISKIKAIKDKVNEKFAMFVKDHPDMVKYYRKFTILMKDLTGLFAMGAGGYVAGDAIGTLLGAKATGFKLKDLGSSVGGVIGKLIVGIGAGVLGYVQIKMNRIKKEESNNMR